MAEIRFSTTENFFKFPSKFATLVNLHTADGLYLKSMFGEQFAYGHREILLKYCGLDFSVQLLGNLQHGVDGRDSELDYRVPRYSLLRKSTHWVYSESYERNAKLLGYKNVVAIGAPWLYLKDSTVQNIEDIPKSNKILVMPSHSQVVFVTTTTLRQKKQRARAFRKVVGSQEATVCLHAIDFCDPEITESFIDEGFRVICIGSSSHSPKWSEAGNRIGTLYKLMTLMKSHSHLVTDSYGSHLIYAIDMGMRIGIYPEILQYFGTKDISERKNPFFETEQRAKDLVFFKRNMPEALGQVTDSRKYKEISDEVLGRNKVRSPSELLEVLVYRKNVFPITPVQPW